MRPIQFAAAGTIAKVNECQARVKPLLADMTIRAAVGQMSIQHGIHIGQQLVCRLP
ncbi:UNVERIFIED_CONTAM: hypothetical protein K7Z70_11915 [Mycobacterium avium subsp. hominissuis]